MSSRFAHIVARGCDSIRPKFGGLIPLGLLLLVFLWHPLGAEEFSAGPTRLPPVPSDILLTSAEELVPSAQQAAEEVQGNLVAPGGVCLVPPQPWRGSYAFADVLLWKLTEGGGENWAQEITPLPSAAGGTAGTATLVGAGFNWNAGFRVGVGSQPCPDDFDATLYYTNFTTTGSSQASGEVYSAFLGNFYVSNPDGAFFGPHYQNASMKWNFGFHNIDYEIGRTYLIDRSLSLRPFVGLKAAIIDQAMNSTWQFPIDTPAQPPNLPAQHYLFTSATENLKQNFWGIGPSLGVTMRMPLSVHPNYSISAFATPSGALMYGHWTFKDQYKTNGPTSTTVPTPTTISINSNPINGAATMARGAVGLEWTRFFPRVTTVVRVSYEAQVWLDQMQFYSFNGGRLSNLMSLQGGVVELGFHY